MFKTISIVALVLIAAVLAYAAVRPDKFEVRRSTSIQAPPQKIFALIDDFHRWGAWSPWEKMDPAMKRTHRGAASGPSRYVAKLMGIFVDMDKMIGKDFETGLANLKTAAEK